MTAENVRPHDRWGLTGIAFPRGRTQASEAWTVEIAPDDPLSTYVIGFWRMSWRLPPGVIVSTHVVPTGCISCVFEPNPSQGRSLQAKVVGARTKAFPLSLAGGGETRGVLFTPGGFAALFGCDAARFTDEVVALRAALPQDADALTKPILASADMTSAVALVNDHLRKRLPPCPPAELVRLHRGWDFISDARNAPSLGALGAFLGCAPRTLQRTWRRLLGIGPKRWIRTRRFQAVLQQLRDGCAVDFAALAARLGYFDQAHLINDFRDFAGARPTEIAVLNR